MSKLTLHRNYAQILETDDFVYDRISAKIVARSLDFDKITAFNFQHLNTYFQIYSFNVKLTYLTDIK